MRSRTSASFCKPLVLAAVVGLAGAGPSVAAGGPLTVSGDSKPSDCGAAKNPSYSSELSGSLTGCWSTFVDKVNCQEMTGFALWTEIGREEFEGELDGQPTNLNTQYTFKGLFPSGTCPEPAADKEIVGGCIHYISGPNLVGEMRFYDVMYGEGAPNFFYEGTLTTY